MDRQKANKLKQFMEVINMKKNWIKLDYTKYNDL